MSERNDLVKALKDRGYRKFKAGTNHDIWCDGTHKITLPRGNALLATNVRNTLADLRRYDRESATIAAVHDIATCLTGLPCPQCRAVMDALAAMPIAADH